MMKMIKRVKVRISGYVNRDFYRMVNELHDSRVLGNDASMIQVVWGKNSITTVYGSTVSLAVRIYAMPD